MIGRENLIDVGGHLDQDLVNGTIAATKDHEVHIVVVRGEETMLLAAKVTETAIILDQGLRSTNIEGGLTVHAIGENLPHQIEGMMLFHPNNTNAFPAPAPPWWRLVGSATLEFPA